MTVGTKTYLNDTGTAIIIDAGEDLSTASLMKIKYLKPSGASGAWIATIVSGEPTKTRYITLSNDLDESGTWKLQLYVEFSTWKGHGEIASFVVYDTIV